MLSKILESNQSILRVMTFVAQEASFTIIQLILEHTHGSKKMNYFDLPVDTIHLSPRVGRE
jgi:hypothetical protein